MDAVATVELKLLVLKIRRYKAMETTNRKVVLSAVDHVAETAAETAVDHADGTSRILHSLIVQHRPTQRWHRSLPSPILMRYASSHSEVWKKWERT